MYSTRLLIAALFGSDPLIFLAPICVSLGVSFVAALRELDRVRVHLRGSNTRRLSRKSQASLSRPQTRGSLNVETGLERLKTIVMFCGVGLLVSLLVVSYGLDLSGGSL